MRFLLVGLLGFQLLPLFARTLAAKPAPLQASVPKSPVLAPQPLPPVPHPSFGDQNPMTWFHPRFSDEDLEQTRRELEKRQLVTRLIHAFRYKWKRVIPVALKKLARLAPNSAEYNYFLALQEYQQGEKGKAWLYVEKSLSAWPEYARAWNLRGILLGESGRYESALASFQKALHWAPFNPVYLYNTASLFYRNGHYDKAGKRIAEALEAKSNLAEGYYLQGLIYRKQDKAEKALESFEKAIQYGFDSKKLVFEFARLALKTGNRQRQAQILPYLQKLAGSESADLQSRIHEGFGEYEKAARVLGYACRRAKTSTPELRKRYVQLLAKTGFNAKYALARLPIPKAEREQLWKLYQRLRKESQKEPTVKDAILKPFG